MLDNETMRKLSTILVLAREDPKAVITELKQLTGVELTEQELLATINKFINLQGTDKE